MSPATLLRALIVLALIPSLLALSPRLRAEHPGPVVLVMDGNAALEEARLNGQTLEQTLAQYREEGIGGVAVYEQTVGNLLEQGLLLGQSGGNLSLQYPQAGFRLGWSYLTGDPDLLRRIAAQWIIPSEFRSAGGRTWLGTPVNVAAYPVGYDAELIRRLKAEGYYLVFRPINAPRRKLPTPGSGVSMVPPEADAIVFSGTEVLGNPNQLEEVIPLLRGKPIGWIEATPQEGFPRLARELPVLRLFSLKPEWQDKLKPAEVADKFVLAARERGHQILYLRPYSTPEDTRDLLVRLKDDLQRSHIPIGTPKVRDFTPSPLRLAAWVGVLAGLGLLALGYPAGGAGRWLDSSCWGRWGTPEAMPVRSWRLWSFQRWAFWSAARGWGFGWPRCCMPWRGWCSWRPWEATPARCWGSRPSKASRLRWSFHLYWWPSPSSRRPGNRPSSACGHTRCGWER